MQFGPTKTLICCLGAKTWCNLVENDQTFSNYGKTNQLKPEHPRPPRGAGGCRRRRQEPGCALNDHPYPSSYGQILEPEPSIILELQTGSGAPMCTFGGGCTFTAAPTEKILVPTSLYSSQTAGHWPDAVCNYYFLEIFSIRNGVNIFC